MANNALTASFGLDIAPLQQSLKRATNAVQNFALGFAGFVSIKATMDKFKESLDLGSHLVDLSNKTGIGAGALYDLGEAGRDAGLSLDDITSSVNKMQKGLGKMENAGVLHALGLDPQSLASAKPEEAFQKIGQAIARLQNPTEQVQAAISIFGKSGAQMLQLFNDPGFQRGLGSSQAAQILEKNAPIFDRLADSLGHIKPRITEFFNGFNSENAANLERMANAIDQLDLSQKGVDAGTIVATFAEAIAQGNIGELLWLSMKIAVEEFTNNMIGGALAMGRALYEIIELIVRPETWEAFGNTLMSFVNSFNATLYHGIAEVIALLEKTPVVGKYFSGASAAVNALGNQSALTAVTQGNQASSLASGLFEDIVGKVKSSFDFGKVIDTSATNSKLQELTDSIYSGLQSSNEKARNKAALEKKTGAYTPSDIGMAAKATIVSDSFAKVGGGGTSSFLGVIDVNRQQLSAQQQTNRLLEQYLKGSGGFSGAQLAH
jgi:anti-sigma regulatory factor (Ser/Thr protein kinase)